MKERKSFTASFEGSMECVEYAIAAKSLKGAKLKAKKKARKLNKEMDDKFGVVVTEDREMAGVLI